TRENSRTLDALHGLLTGIGDGISWKIMPVNTKKKRFRIDACQIRELEDASTGWYLAGENPFRSGYFTHKALISGKYGSIYYGSHRCYMPWIHMFADPEGFCYPCCMTRGKIPSIGKYPDQSLTDILHGSRSSGIRLNMASGNPLPVCAECGDFIRENSIIHGLSKERVKRI
ncbi:MAG: SPASM domain-containing protein, partial [Nitrospirae bacterium]|nr:SPASM domain-containing protein [Nitrospirota bacterium]